MHRMSRRLKPTAALVLLTPLAAAADPLCLVGGTVVDPEQRKQVAADVVISDGRITAVGARAGRACSGRTLEVRRAFVMPGLIDLHVHPWGNPSPIDGPDEEPGAEEVLRLVLRAGVMAVVDVAGNRERLALRNRLRGSPDHATLVEGMVAGARRGGETTVRERVRAAKQAGADVIKLFGQSDGVPAAIDEARRLGLTTIVHIDDWDEARAAARAGASALTHFEDEAVIPTDLVRLMAERGVRSIPTMAVQCDLARMVERPALLDDPLLARLTGPVLRAAYRTPERFIDKARHWLDWQRAGCVPHDYPSVRRLHAAGVPVLAGSDTGNLGTFQGFSLHRELELLAEAGLPPWEALRAGSTEAARFLRLPWGIRPGAPANLVVVEASPVERIANTRRIRHVIHRGQLVAP
jgi:imidazolonepropionase-like amidohydrolase